MDKDSIKLLINKDENRSIEFFRKKIEGRKNEKRLLKIIGEKTDKVNYHKKQIEERKIF